MSNESSERDLRKGFPEGATVITVNLGRKDPSTRDGKWIDLHQRETSSGLGTVGPVKIAMLGTRGVPALHGGFETAVEQIGARLVERGHEVTVYSRNPGQEIAEYRGMSVVNLPALRHRFTETLTHTALSSAHTVLRSKPDVAMVFNAGNAPLLRPLIRSGVPTAVHLDGLESRRDKWRGAGARYYRWAEKAATKWADAVVVDSQEIAQYVERTYGRQAVFIPYGAEVIDPGSDRLAELNLVRRDFHLVVARLEPENHVLDAVIAYRRSEETRPLVVVGSAPYSRWYIDKVHDAAADDTRIHFLGGVYDQQVLDQLYGNCRTYIHGHSVGGTNPSLLRAMGAGAPVLAFDCSFNREVTNDQALFWMDADELTVHLDDVAESSDVLDTDDTQQKLAELSASGRSRISRHYQWDAVTAEYERLLAGLAKLRVAA